MNIVTMDLTAELEVGPSCKYSNSTTGQVGNWSNVLDEIKSFKVDGGVKIYAEKFLNKTFTECKR